MFFVSFLLSFNFIYNFKFRKSIQKQSFYKHFYDLMFGVDPDKSLLCSFCLTVHCDSCTLMTPTCLGLSMGAYKPHIVICLQ